MKKGPEEEEGRSGGLPGGGSIPSDWVAFPKKEGRIVGAERTTGSRTKARRDQHEDKR